MNPQYIKILGGMVPLDNLNNWGCLISCNSSCLSCNSSYLIKIVNINWGIWGSELIKVVSIN